MDKMELIQQIFEICVIPLLAVLTGFLCDYIKAKAAQLKQTKYTELITNTICDCVKATNQTYVETLKKEGKFDAEAQKKAFDMTLQSVISVLSIDAQDFIRTAYGDLDKYLESQIEANVNTVKG